MSDNLSVRWRQILEMTNRETSDDVVIARSSFDDFSQPTPCRTFEIVCGGQSFYVNSGWLAELSPYFAEELFVRKPNLERYVIDQATPDEILEFLRCITFCPMRKPLSVKNVPLVLKFANRFEMRPVQARCENFIATNTASLSCDKKKLFEFSRFQVACAMSQCDPNSSTMSLLVGQLAGTDNNELSRMHFAEMPGDVVAEVYAQKIQKEKAKKSGRYKAGDDAAPVGCCLTQWATSVFHRRRNEPDQSILLGGGDQQKQHHRSENQRS